MSFPIVLREISKVIICSGKHYYTLNARRIEKQIKDTAIVRLEVSFVR